MIFADLVSGSLTRERFLEEYRKAMNDREGFAPNQSILRAEAE